MPAEASPTTRLLAALSARSTLLVVDNCEHLVDAVAELVAALLPCSGCACWPPAANPCGDGRRCRSARRVDGSSRPAAGRLFTERAAAVRPGFAWTDDAAPTSARDLPAPGRPAAGDRAGRGPAAHADVASSGGLADRFRLLTGGSRTALPRHRTLRAVVAWSWDLLTDGSGRRCGGCRCSRGSATSGAVERVCAVADVMDVLDSLVDRVVALGDRRALRDAGDGRRLRGRTSTEPGDALRTTARRLSACRWWVRRPVPACDGATPGFGSSGTSARTCWPRYSRGPPRWRDGVVAAPGAYGDIFLDAWGTCSRRRHAATVLNQLPDGARRRGSTRVLFCVIAAANSAGRPDRRHAAAALSVAMASPRHSASSAEGSASSAKAALTPVPLVAGQRGG